MGSSGVIARLDAYLHFQGRSRLKMGFFFPSLSNMVYG